LVNPCLLFEIWTVDFVGPFQKREKISGEKYIITVVKYFTKREEAKLVGNCTKETTAQFIYVNIVTRFNYPLMIISDQGTHFVSNTIEVLLKKLMIDHGKTIVYHPQANGAIDYFNKKLHKGLTKICDLDRENWDDKVPTILWAYRTTYKISTVQTPFKLVYGQEAVILLHFCANTGPIDSILEFDHMVNTRQCFYHLKQLE
jgi:transposase InsO family protein